ncbi:4a-hydroxytetrahydrobiopterin dehydratase [Celeribacter neptunius]|uniref:Putative pterin-4-alpha-carbinolamine dehydratase n=1 Tax=Celeribacter neptunius TaxID=588602 RepID=A0A1I3WXS5_9RHOB|nr:4a-hydroxytetrahydrobiopterin dehydratase [Celeribacter neptunius]SFK12265.1 pterin-4-alpha-carbinolamine dehydratase [Celeribacter neptunius]
MTELLKDPEKATILAPLLANGWSETESGAAIAKHFLFANFVEAFAFMTRVALIVEKMDHHPDWSNVYRSVDVILSTHDAGGVTLKDVRLAEKMDEATAHV